MSARRAGGGRENAHARRVGIEGELQARLWLPGRDLARSGGPARLVDAAGAGAGSYRAQIPSERRAGTHMNSVRGWPGPA